MRQALAVLAFGVSEVHPASLMRKNSRPAPRQQQSAPYFAWEVAANARAREVASFRADPSVSMPVMISPRQDGVRVVWPKKG